ncbi:hypothetical protein H0H93_007392 [Arthromyces matolae]|nr:hypothetical protein H0H93_007392 [Arthromyces matolae]
MENSNGSEIAPIPTIDDLREEELYDSPEDPPRPWTHPCTCTLIAHEQCLLLWIQTSQADLLRANNALKCPQCGAKYQLVSERPPVLRFLGLGNSILQKAGRYVIIFSLGGVVAIFSSGIYAVATLYGSWAVKQFIGKEAERMHSLLLTDDPSHWRWTTFLNLPTIPFALITSRIGGPTLIPSVIPLLLLWPPIPPVHVPEILAANASNVITPSSFLPADLRISRPLSSILWSWPPTPALFGFVIVPFVRFVYRKAWNRVQIAVLGCLPPSARNTSKSSFWDRFPIVIRFNNQDVVDGGQMQDAEARGEGNQAQAQDGPGPDERLAELGAPAVEAADEALVVNRFSVGRIVGGALLIPWISSRMGALLLAMSKHSNILRRIIAVRPPLGTIAGIGRRPSFYPGLLAQVQKGLSQVWRSSLGGSPVWTEADPVWWRNALGFGLFVFAKDVVELLHLWLATRELASRHVKNRDFSGIDTKELDLIPGFLRPSRAENSTQLTQQRSQSV